MPCENWKKMVFGLAWNRDDIEEKLSNIASYILPYNAKAAGYTVYIWSLALRVILLVFIVAWTSTQITFLHVGEGILSKCSCA